MEISLKLEKADWYKYQSYIGKELPKSINSWTNSFLFNLVVWAVLAFFFMLIFQNISEFHWPTAGAVSVFFILLTILFFVNMAKLKNACAPSESGVFIGTHKFIFNESGITSKGTGYYGSHNWSLVKRIERNDGLILIFLDSAYAFVFPEHKLENPDEFYQYISGQIEKI